MQETNPNPSSVAVQVGPDLLTITGNQITIDALHEMPDWQVREFARVPVYVGERKYFLREKTPGQKPYAMRYLLEVWPADHKEPNNSFLVYDEEAVAEREASFKSGRVDDIGRCVLILFYPLLGMLWSRTKEKMMRFGFVPRSITGVSIFTTFGLMLLQAVFAKVLIFTSLRTGNIVLGGMIRAFANTDYLNLGLFQVRLLWFDIALFVFLFLDVIIRYSQHLRDVEVGWGFMEWITCIFPKKKSYASQSLQNPSL